MQGIKWGFTCVFTQFIKRPDDPDQYRTGYDLKLTQVNRIRNSDMVMSRPLVARPIYSTVTLSVTTVTSTDDRNKKS